MPSHNVDDLLNAKLTPTPVSVTPPANIANSANLSPDVADSTDNSPIPEPDEEKLSYSEQFKKDKEEILGKQEPEIAENMQKDQEKEPEAEVKQEVQPKNDEVDEYGNELPKARTYTEEEVQRMIRDRLSRGKAIEPPAQPTQQQVNQAKQDGFEANPNSEESWEEQLNKFIDRRVESREKQAQERQWKEHEHRIQAEFEAKFSTGMQKYKDFQEVVEGKPITNSMLLAARSMKDPAAFIYAAAKQQPKELERISQINDSYQQAAEMGRLEERMKKARTLSKTPAPASKTKGDITGTDMGKPSIDQLIQHDAKRKLGRR